MKSQTRSLRKFSKYNAEPGSAAHGIPVFLYNKSMNTFELREITVHYGRKTALDRISLQAEAGECVAVAGPSGSGKTTLLRAAAGLLRPSSGSILLDGKEAVSLPAASRHMAMIFQDAALFPHSRVSENISYGLHALGFRKEEIRRKTADAAERLGVQHLLDRYPQTLSAGERQRVGIARAIVREPEILLLDEPFANLDFGLRTQLQQEMMKIQKENGMMMLMVTHDRSEALMMADRIVLLQDGQCVETAAPAQITDDPENLFTARFFAPFPMETIRAEIRRGVLFLPGGKMRADGADGMYQAVVRPYAAAEGDSFSAEVSAVWKHEDRWAMNCDSEGFRYSFLAERPAAVGSRITFSLHPRYVFLFDGDGKRARIHLEEWNFPEHVS